FMRRVLEFTDTAGYEPGKNLGKDIAQLTNLMRERKEWQSINISTNGALDDYLRTGIAVLVENYALQFDGNLTGQDYEEFQGHVENMISEAVAGIDPDTKMPENVQKY